MRHVLKFLSSIAVLVVSFAVIIVFWVYSPTVITDVMDANLAIIKWLGDQPHMARAEAALRFLAGEKMLLLAEATLAIRMIILILKLTFVSR